MRKPQHVTMMAGLLLSLAGCQSVHDHLNSLNENLAKMTGKSQASDSASQPATTPSSPPAGKSISNKWHITDTQAMNWLAHDQKGWNDHGKIHEVDWDTFWAQQIHADTPLSRQAKTYCYNNKPWDDQKTGDNCEVYIQAKQRVISRDVVEANEKANKRWDNH